MHRAAVVPPAGSAPPVSAHVLQDLADVELGKRLQSRLATLGISAGSVQVEVRANANSDATSASRTFTLTITGKLQLNLGSLFNILIHSFLKQHTQITSIERRVSFHAAPSSSASAAKSVDGKAVLSNERIVDSAPILALKVAHLAKLLTASNHTVVYAGEALCQGSAPAIPTRAMTAPMSTPPAHSSLLEELAAPHPPSVLARWVRNGTIRHIISESTDGFFNVTAQQSKSSSLASRLSSGRNEESMSDDEDVHSVVSSSSSSSTSSVDEQPLTSDQLSELYGNKFKEECTAAGGCSGNGSGGATAVYYRDFEVRQMRFGALQQHGSTSPTSVSADSHLTGRLCTYCSSPLRDTLVEWNESLPRGTLQRAVTLAAQAELSLILGSQLLVTPTCDMPQLSSASSQMVIVSPFATAKDAECLEAGGVLIRKEPAVVLAELDALLKKQSAGKSSSAVRKAMKATIVRKGSATTATPAIAVASSSNAAASVADAIPAMSRDASGSSVLARNLSIPNTWTKRSNSGSSQTVQQQQMEAARKRKSLMHFAQRRGADLNRGSSGLLRTFSNSNAFSKPAMLRAATAAAGLMSSRSASNPMRLSAALPPFPLLDDDDDRDGMVNGVRIPAASAPSRAWTEDVSMVEKLSLRQQTTNTMPAVGSGALLFPEATLGLPSLPTVSSPVFLASRGCSLEPPSQWIHFATPQQLADSGVDPDVVMNSSA